MIIRTLITGYAHVNVCAKSEFSFQPYPEQNTVQRMEFGLVIFIQS